MRYTAEGGGVDSRAIIWPGSEEREVIDVWRATSLVLKPR